MQEVDKIKIAIVGAGREGLETLSLLIKESDVAFSMLLDPDEGALGFRLGEYRYTYAEGLNLRLSHRMRDLSTIQDLNLIIDTTPEKYHKALYDLDGHPVEIIDGRSASFIWGLRHIGDVEKRRSFIFERINDVIETINEGLQSVSEVRAIDEHSALMLRTSFLGTHAESAQLTLGGKDGPYRLIKDINIKSNLLIKKGFNRLYINEWDEADKIIRYVVENKMSYEEEKLSVIPLIEESDVIGMLWLFYTSQGADIQKDDTAFITSLLPLFGRSIKDAIEAYNSAPDSVEEALSAESLRIIDSEKPIGSKLREVNQTISKFLKADDSHIYIKDPATGDLVLQATTCKFPSLRGRIWVKKGRGVLSEVIERRKPVILLEAGIDNHNLSQRFARKEDAIALLYLPLIVKDEGVGIISMEFTNTHNLTSDIYNSLINMGARLANTIGSDVERYRMSQKIIKLSAVNEEGVEILSTVDLQKALALTTTSSAMLLDSEVSIIRLCEDEKLVVKSTYGLRQDKGSQTLLDLDHNISMMVSQTKVPMLIHDLSEYTDMMLSPDFTYKTAIVLPLSYNRQLLGTLSLYNKMATEVFDSVFFTEDDRETLERFTQYVSRGVINARRYSERQSLITIDEVTGLRNERYLKMRFPEEINRASRYNRSVSLMFFDVRPFDEDIIRDLAKIVKETFRYIDVLVRLKDAKFATLLPDTGEGVKEAAKRLSVGFNRLKQERPELTLYVGYSTYPNDSKDMQELIIKSSKLYQY